MAVAIFGKHRLDGIAEHANWLHSCHQRCQCHTDDTRCRRVGSEFDAVVERDFSELRQQRHDCVLVVGNPAGERVEIGGGSASTVCGRQHSAFDHEFAGAAPKR
jgi:hypothetical protein